MHPSRTPTRRLRGPRLSRSAYVIGCLIAILGHTASAQDEIDPGRQLAQKIYLASEKIVKGSIDEKMRLFSAQKRRDGQPLTNEDLEVGLDIITRSQYQHLIDNLVCAEQLSDESARSK